MSEKDVPFEYIHCFNVAEEITAFEHMEETHDHSITLQSIFYQQSQAENSFWTKHGGIVYLSPSLTISDIIYSPCGRIKLCIVPHSSSYFTYCN